MKTTMAKLARENRLRERRLNKQAKKDARKQTSSDHLDVRDARADASSEDASISTGQEPSVGLAQVRAKIDPPAR